MYETTSGSSRTAVRAMLLDAATLRRKLVTAMERRDTRGQMEYHQRLVELRLTMERHGLQLAIEGAGRTAEVREVAALETRKVTMPSAAPRRGRADDDEDEPLSLGKVKGYGAVFYNAADEGTQYQLYEDLLERIDPNAFTACLATKPDVRCMYNHDANQLLGRTAAGNLVLSVDRIGLAYDCKPTPTSYARDLFTNLRAGLVTGSSFVFQVTDVRWLSEGDQDIRLILACDCFELGPVAMPAYAATTAKAAARGKEPKGRAVPVFDAMRRRLTAAERIGV